MCNKVKLELNPQEIVFCYSMYKSIVSFHYHVRKRLNHSQANFSLSVSRFFFVKINITIKHARSCSKLLKVEHKKLQWSYSSVTSNKLCCKMMQMFERKFPFAKRKHVALHAQLTNK
jgi:hypothetical protein